jgi:hypothetical protein
MTFFKTLSPVSCSVFALAALALSAPAFASVNVSSPYYGEQVSSPFTLSANSPNCSNQPVSAMGYSFDSSSSTTVVNANSINRRVGAPGGTHTLHVKAWGDRGASCVHDVVVHVSGTSSGSSPGEGVAPPNTARVSSLQVLGNWQEVHDAGTNGWSSGSMALVHSPSTSGNARRFITSYSNSSGERYYVTFADDTAAHNFFYDGWVYIADSSSTIANLELDLNQVMSNGETVIYGFQCDGWTGTWDFTENRGSPQNPDDAWVHSQAGCNVRNWGRNQWHHIQISYSRDDSGAVTYHTVWLDGRGQGINATVPSAFALGWGPTLLTNFQVDGMGGGTATVYLDNLAVYRW